MIKTVFRYLLAVLMIAAGISHFTNPGPFEKIVPAYLGHAQLLVQVSGVFEVLGGAGLLVARTRKLAAWGLVALFVAVFPANLNQAMNHIAFDDAHPIPQAALWIRLPIQIVLIAWAAWMTRDPKPQGGA